MGSGGLVPAFSSILLVLVALGLIAGIAAFFAGRIVKAVEHVGEGYTDLYKQQHREVMEALRSETVKALADTKALVMEHTELERILRALQERADEDDEAERVEGDTA